MSKEIFINVSSQERRVAILKDKHLEEFLTERPDYINVVGNIYKGKVESVLPGMGAAFVEIGLGRNGFLYVSDVLTGLSSYEKLLEEEADEEVIERREREKPLPSISELLKKGDEIIVQVVKEPIGTKGPRLTTHISIPGRYLVLMPFDSRIGLSKRIDEKAKRERIKRELEELKLPKDSGFIVRTAASSASKRDFFRESRYLIRLWQHIKYKSSKVRAPQLIHQEYDLILSVARDLFTDDVSRLDVDSKIEFKRIIGFLKAFSPHLSSKVKFHSERAPLFEKFDIERQIDKLYNRISPLKSGGYIVFDETEALVAIDVNSGRFVGRRNLEDTAFKTNLEAAEEIPRQLRLRDIGGIIIIDFIDMEVPHHRREVFQALEKALEDDKAKTNILNISSIGLVEMTRQRVRRSIESKHYQKCPYCNGRGMVKSASTIAIELGRKLERLLLEKKSAEIFVSLHPDVAAYCLAKERSFAKDLERRFRKRIRIIEDPRLHIEDIKIDEAR